MNCSNCRNFIARNDIEEEETYRVGDVLEIDGEKYTLEVWNTSLGRSGDVVLVGLNDNLQPIERRRLYTDDYHKITKEEMLTLIGKYSPTIVKLKGENND